MKFPIRRYFAWASMLIGLLAIGHVASGIWPKTNQLHIRLPQGQVRSVDIVVFGSDGEALRSIERFVPLGSSSEIVQSVELPDGKYLISLTFLYQPPKTNDKSHSGDWTRMGVQHQIRLTGADHRFPPPDEER